MSLIHYISATRRLKESEKTIRMLGGKENCARMFLAQSEMTRLEVEFYKEQCIKQSVFAGAVLVGLLVGVFVYFKVLN